MSLLGILMRERERWVQKYLYFAPVQYNLQIGAWVCDPRKMHRSVSVLVQDLFLYTILRSRELRWYMHVLSNTFARTGVFRVRRSPAPELLNLAKTTIKRQLKDYFNRNWVHINLLIIKSLNASDKRKGGMSKEKISHGDTFLSMFALT